MTEQEVVALMKTSKTEAEWNKNCDKVKAACGGYPEFWFRALVISGVMRETTAAFGGNDQIHISVGTLPTS